MRFYDFSPERTAEYMRRINRVIKAHPYDRYPSQFDRDFLCYAMGLNLTSTSMNMASRLGDTKLCEKIYSEKSNTINAKDNKGNTPLMNAVQRKRLGTAEWLLDHGAKILPNKQGYNPVLWACVQGCVPALNMFKHYGVDFNQPAVHWSWFGCPGDRHLPKREVVYPIMLALKQPKALQFLIDNGASIDVRYESGKSIRDNLEKHPERLIPKSREILLKKAAQTPAPVPVAKKTFWQRLSFSKTKE